MPPDDETLPARVPPAAPPALPAAVESWRRDALALATGLDPDERLRALSALMRADLPTDARRGLALFALRDESARVRRAAVTALRHAGLDGGVADGCAALLAESRAERARGLAALQAAAAPDADRWALAVTLVAAGACLRDPEWAGERAGLLRVCGRLGRAVARHPALLADLTGLVLREAAAGPHEAGAALREALRGLAASAPPGFARALLDEAARLTPGPGRTAVLLTLAELPLRGAARAAFDALLLDTELARYLEVGEGLVPFRAFVAAHGARLLPGLAARAARERGERRAAVLALVGVALREAEPAPSPAARRRAAAVLAPLAGERDPATTVALLRAGLAADAGLPAAVRRAVVAAALDLLAAGASDEFADETFGAAAALGPESLTLLLGFAGDDLLARPLRRAALRHAATVAAAAPVGGPDGRRVLQGLRAARRLAARPGFALADAVLALAGALAAHPAVPARARDATRRALERALRAAPAPLAAGAAEGLAAWAGAHGSALDEADRLGLVRDLLRLIEAAHGAGVVATGADGRAEAAGAALHTRAIPAALAALTSLARGRHAVPVAHALLGWWGRLTRGELVVGPSARARVAGTLADLALAAGEPALRARAAAALLAEHRRTGELPLVPVIVRLLASATPLAEAEGTAAAFARALLDAAGARDATDEERAVAFAAAASLVASGAVPRGSAESLLPALIRLARGRALGPDAADAARALAAVPWLRREDREALQPPGSHRGLLP